MGSIKWIELGKFAIGVLLAGLIIVVSNLLAQGSEQSKLLENQAEIVRTLAITNSVPDPIHQQKGAQRFDLYKLKAGGSVVFLPCDLGGSIIELAVSLDRNNEPKDCRVVSFTMPPQSILVELMAAEVGKGKIKFPSQDYSKLEQEGIELSAANQRQIMALATAVKQASEISRSGGKL